VDFIRRWVNRTKIPAYRMIGWAGISLSKFHTWHHRYGKVNEHNCLIPRDHWLEECEKELIVDYFKSHPLEGYRRLAFMMLDDDVVAVSPSSVYRVLKSRGLIDPWNRKASKKGTGFVQPLKPHQHWHIDITYINICGTFFYLCSILDGYSRYLVHWDIRESMKESDVELIVQAALEKHPGVKPRIISDNGSQFIAKDFKSFVRLTGITHVRTSPYYPQSNGKKERFYGTLKKEKLRQHTLRTLEEGRKLIEEFIQHYNEVRLHFALKYVTPKDKLEGRENEIFKERDRKLEAARAQRAGRRKEAFEGREGRQVAQA
jgi:transposase InsO family protein